MKISYRFQGQKIYLSLFYFIKLYMGSYIISKINFWIFIILTNFALEDTLH